MAYQASFYVSSLLLLSN